MKNKSKFSDCEIDMRNALLMLAKGLILLEDDIADLMLRTETLQQNMIELKSPPKKVLKKKTKKK